METKQVANYFKILSDETRIKIIKMLKEGSMCACNILKNLNITQPTLSYHMKLLSDNNLVHSSKRGVWVDYSLNADEFKKLAEFLVFDDKNCTKDSCNCKNK